MKNTITQVHNISPEDFKKEIVKDVVADIKLELQQIATSFQPKETPKFIDSKEVSKILGVSNKTLIDWRKKGILKAYRIANKIRFKRFEVEDSLTLIKQ